MQKEPHYKGALFYCVPPILQSSFPSIGLNHMDNLYMENSYAITASFFSCPYGWPASTI